MSEATAFYRAMRVLSALPAWYFRFRVEGGGNVPATGACILAGNHASYLDPIVLAMACPRPVRFIVDSEQYVRPMVHWIAVRTGAIPVSNNPRDLGSLRAALQALRAGRVLGIFPEGGRTDDGTLKPGKPGAALLALRAGVPLVPAGIVGTYASFSRHHRLPRRLPVTVRFGAPLAFPPEWGGRAAKDHLEEATVMIMGRIGELRG